MSFDIGIAGEVAGIIQISAEIFCLKIAALRKVEKDCIKEVHHSPTIFNIYFLLWTDMWEQRCIDVHQIPTDEERITSADKLKLSGCNSIRGSIGR